MKRYELWSDNQWNGSADTIREITLMYAEAMMKRKDIQHEIKLNFDNEL